MAFGKCEKDLSLFSECSVGKEMVQFIDSTNGNSDEMIRSEDLHTVRSKYQADSVIKVSGAQGRDRMWII